MDELPQGVRDFLSRRIDSVEQIAILALLRSDSAREWTVEAISAELRSAASAIERRLNGLYREGVLVRPADGGRVRFAPASSEVAETIDHIVDAFRSHPSRVIEVIYSKPGRE